MTLHPDGTVAVQQLTDTRGLNAFAKWSVVRSEGRQ